MTEQDEKPQDGSLETLLRRVEKKTAGKSDHSSAEEDAGHDKERVSYVEREERARKAFKHLTDIDDEERAPLTLRGLLGGDILGSPAFRRNILYVLMVAVMLIIYVNNRYACQKEIIRGEELGKELADRKFKLLTVSSELTEYSMRSNIEENLPDSTLQTADRPSYYMPVEAEEP